MDSQIFLLLILLYATQITTACVHDQIKKTSRLVNGFVKYKTDRRSTEFSKLRLKFETRFIESSDIPWAKKSYLENILSIAEKRLTQLVEVIPVSGPLYVPRNCSMYWTREDHDIVCGKASDINKCVEVSKIPAEHLGLLNVESPTGFKQSIKAGNGIVGSDLLVYVTYNQTTHCANGAVLAYASACHLDQNDRPIVGSINFCPGMIQPSVKQLDADRDSKIVIHEMFHVLGFSLSLYSFFRDEQGLPRTPRCPNAIGCTEKDWPNSPPFSVEKGMYMISDSTLATKFRGTKQVNYLVTPSVRKIARAYFSCMELPGVELENDGSADGTAGSHWEERILFTEIMAGMLSYPFIEVNYAAADATPMIFGRGLGCDQLNVCGISYPYCDTADGTKSTLKCTFDRSAMGSCTKEPFMDECSVNYPFTNTRCDNATGLSSIILRCNGADCRGSNYAPGSGCFDSTLMLVPFHFDTGGSDSNVQVGCYPFRCKDEFSGFSLEIQGPDGVWQSCPAGQAITVKGFTGSIQCPPDHDLICIQDCRKGPCPIGQYPSPCDRYSTGFCVPCSAVGAAACDKYEFGPEIAVPITNTTLMSTPATTVKKNISIQSAAPLPTGRNLNAALFLLSFLGIMHILAYEINEI